MSGVEEVWRALSSKQAKSVAQLAEETGLSESTVRRHLLTLKTKEVPVRMSKQLLYMRPEEPVQEHPVKYWRRSRIVLSEEIRKLTISEHSDPAQLADTFLLIGRQLVAIGAEIDRVKADPDWYQRLGGQFWLSDGERNE